MIHIRGEWRQRVVGVVLQDEESIGEGKTPRARDAVRVPRLGWFAKRAFDVVAATMGLLLFAPILLITSIAIKLDSRGPILIRETLYGYKNRAIEVRKFRVVTVRPEGERIDLPLTWVGQILRRTGIDELPQLFNVLRGEMSIIGPRPCTHPTALLNRDKPGLTDWAQIVSFPE